MSPSSFSGLRLVAATAVIAVAAGGALVAPSATASTDDSSRAATSISIRLEHRAIAPGGSGDVLGSLRTPGVDPGGRQVSLEAKPEGATSFTPVATATAGDHGGLRATVAPEVTTRYRWYYPGADDARARRSGVVNLVVRERSGHHANRLGTSLSIRAVHRLSGVHGDVLRGRLLSRRTGLPHRRVQLVAHAAAESGWHFVASKRTAREGRVAFHVTPRRSTAYRLVFPGTQVFRPSHSGVVHVGVRPHVAIAVSPRRLDPGQATAISGTVTHDGGPVAGATVDLLARPTRPHTKFHVIGTQTLASDGTVTFSAAPRADTTYRLGVHRTTGSPAGVSRAVNVHVRYATSVSIRSRHTADSFVVSGILKGHGQFLGQRKVTLQMAPSGSSEFTAVGSQRTGRRGGVRFERPLAAGSSYRLTYAGAQRYAGSTSGIVVD